MEQKADASVKTTIKPAAASSAVVRDWSKNWKMELRRNSGRIEAFSDIVTLSKDLQTHLDPRLRLNVAIYMWYAVFKEQSTAGI